MKRWIAVFCVLCMLLSLCACGEESPVTEEPTTEPPTTEPVSTEPPTTEPVVTEPPTTEAPDPYKIVGNQVQVYQVSSGTVWALVTISVENTGTEDLWMDYATITLKTVVGKEIAVMDSVSAYPQILKPGETGYYCDTIALDLAEMETMIAFIEADIQPTEKEVQRYTFSDVTLTDTSFGGILLEGTVSNDTETVGELVCVSAILLDEVGRPLGFISGYLDQTLAAGESKDFAFESFMLPEGLDTRFVSNYVLYAFPVDETP